MTVDFSRVFEGVNKKFSPYWNDYRRTQLFKGAAGSGKSRYIAQRQIYRTVTVKNHNGVCVRNDKTNNHSSTFSELCEVITTWGLFPLFKINTAEGKESITCRLNWNKIIFRGTSEPEKIKSITIPGGGIAWIWPEEATEQEEKAFNQLMLRIRGVGTTPKYIIMSFNPIDIDHWIKARFFDNRIEPEDGFICESTYLDNPYLTKEDIRAITRFKDIDYYYYMVYALNQWGSLTTAKVFQNIEIHDFDIPEWDYKNIRQGQDFGWNDPQVFVRVGFIDGELYIFHEIYKTHTQNKDFIQLIKDSGFPTELMITSDSQDPGKIAENNDNGLYCVGAVKGPGSIHNGVQFLKALPKIHIHKTNCPNACREFIRYKHREDRHGKIFDKEYTALNDHTIDAVRYALEEFAISGIGGDDIDYTPVMIR